MELNITEFFNNAAPQKYSASRMELGQDAGRITWNAAKEGSSDYMFLTTDEQREEFRKHVKSFGAWDDAEIAAWTDVELNALCIQMISGDMREAGIGPDMTDAEWAEYEAEAARGSVHGNISRNDDGTIYYYIGN